MLLRYIFEMHALLGDVLELATLKPQQVTGADAFNHPLAAPGDVPEQTSVKAHEVTGAKAFHDLRFASYEEYVQGQRSKTDAILARKEADVPNWIKHEDVQFLAQYMQLKMRLPFTNKFALAHGTRSGREQKWFMEALPGELVLGTELSPNATGLYTVVMDFHDVKPEWLRKADFVYSNALDHSYNPTFAVQQWMREVSSDGVLIVEWSKSHTKEGLRGDIDIFGGSLQEFQDLICNAGPFHIAAVVKSPTRKEKRVHYIFVRHADHT